MQTFLPHESFVESAKILDYRRLGKQRVECKQILMAIKGKSKGWINHPATKMWKESPLGLTAYALTICDEWLHRGYNDSLLDFFLSSWVKEIKISYALPKWFYGEELDKVVESHRSNLLRKDPVYYSQFNWDVPPDLPYYWPVK